MFSWGVSDFRALRIGFLGRGDGEGSLLEAMLVGMSNAVGASREGADNPSKQKESWGSKPHYIGGRTPNIMSYLWGFPGSFEVEYSMPRRRGKVFAALLTTTLDHFGPSVGPPTETGMEPGPLSSTASVTHYCPGISSPKEGILVSASRMDRPSTRWKDRSSISNTGRVSMAAPSPLHFARPKEGGVVGVVLISVPRELWVLRGT